MTRQAFGAIRSCLLLAALLLGMLGPAGSAADVGQVKGLAQPGTAVLQAPQMAQRVYLPALTRFAEPTKPVQPAALWLPYTTLDSSYVGTGNTSIAIDPAGGVHIAYRIVLSYDAGQRPAYYLYCPASCEDPARWSRVRLSNNIIDVRLRLDSAGRPRMLFYVYVNPNDMRPEALKQYQYASCDNGCAEAANWQITPIAEAISYDERRQSINNHYFALDAQGQPAFVYEDLEEHGGHGGTFYLACRQVPVAQCHNPANWQERAISRTIVLDEPELAFTPGGEPRILAKYVDPDQFISEVVYLECNADCSQGRSTRLYKSVALSRYSLRLDRSGRPRAVYYTETASGPLEPWQLYYLWCNASCTVPSSWSAYNLRTQYGNGWSVDLQLDAQDRPRFVYKAGDVGPGYAWCNLSCESEDAAWQALLLESRDKLQQEHPVYGTPACSQASWTSGQLPALALDAQGNPRVSFDVKHKYGGVDLRPGREGQPCDVTTNIPLSRYLQRPQP